MLLKSIVMCRTFTSPADANQHELGLTTDLVEELSGMPSVNAVSEVRQPQRPGHTLLMLTLLLELCLQHAAVGVLLMTASHQQTFPEAPHKEGSWDISWQALPTEQSNSGTNSPHA